MASESGVELRRSVGGRRTFDEVWGGATSICHRQSQSMGLGFDLWRRGMTDLGLGFKESDM